MNVQSILDRIAQDAKDAAAQTIARATEEADLIKKQSRQIRAQMREDALTAAVKQGSELSMRMKTMAGLDARKADLAAKRALLDETFKLALAQMDALPADRAVQYGIKTILALAEGNETIVPGTGSSWCDEAFVMKANRELANAGRTAGLKLGEPRSELLSGGFLICKDGMEMNCTYRAMLAMMRPDMEADVASRLFG